MNHLLEGIAATATAAIIVASENRLHTIDRHRRYRTIAKAVVHRINFFYLPRTYLRGLRHLRRLHGRHIELILQADIFTLRSRQLALHAIKFQSAQFVKDRLRAASLRVDDVAGILGIGGAGRARCLSQNIAIFKGSALEQGAWGTASPTRRIRK